MTEQAKSSDQRCTCVPCLEDKKETASNGYSAPEDACVSYQILDRALEAF